MKSPMTAARAHASLAGLGLVLLMSACAPSTPDVDAWRTNAQHALSDGASAVHAAEVAKDKVTDAASTAADKVRRETSIQPAP